MVWGCRKSCLVSHCSDSAGNGSGSASCTAYRSVTVLVIVIIVVVVACYLKKLFFDFSLLNFRYT